MAQAEIKLETLVSKLQQLDQSLIQRVADFVDGIFAAQNEEADWWDELPQSVKDDHAQGEKEGEEGKVILVEDFLKKYNR